MAGPGMNINFTEYDTTQYHPLGTLVEDGRNVYMYVKNDSADTAGVAGKMACAMTAKSYGVVTMKESEVTAGGLGTVTKPMGIFMSALPIANYGWIQVRGVSTTLVTDGGVADGDALVCDGGATETFIADTAVAGEEHAVIGHALAADSSANVVTARVNFL